MTPARLLLDTDCNTDCGDAGALAVLHALADAGEVEILGIGVCVSNPDVPAAIHAINAYYGRAEVPLGRYTGKPPVEPTGHAFVTALRNMEPSYRTDTVPDTTPFYRQVLAAQPDASVTFTAIGFLNTLQRLLESLPDEHAPLQGRDLVRTKVNQLIVMGGQYPDSASITPLGGAEYNFYKAPVAAARVCAEWPTPIVFTGFEVGAPIIAGHLLVTRTPADNPVRVAYERYGHPDGRSAWDETAIFYAVRGAHYDGVNFFEKVRGINTVNPATGYNKFQPGSGSHVYLRKSLPDEQYAAVFDELQIRAPGS
jgi:inosine-uridine nucleoside N-ribohydrolase